MNRDAALDLLKKHIKSDSMLKHSLASEAVLRAMARELGQDQDEWGLAGLLHDIDVEFTAGDPARHGFEARGVLEGQVPPQVINAIEAHNAEGQNKTRNTVFEHALCAGETISGFITAVALIYPDKKVASVKTKSITKRMKDARFAAGVSRVKIMECEKAGIAFERFAELSLNAMQEAAPSLGL